MERTIKSFTASVEIVANTWLDAPDVDDVSLEIPMDIFENENGELGIRAGDVVNRWAYGRWWIAIKETAQLPEDAVKAFAVTVGGYVYHCGACTEILASTDKSSTVSIMRHETGELWLNVEDDWRWSFEEVPTPT